MSASVGSVPDRTSSSATRSRLAESEAVASVRGMSSASRPSQTGARREPWREATQLRLPWSVLISPLWPRNRIGWASGHLGVVLVEKRRW